MEFNLTRDLVFFDVESTGLNVIKDRILQIALIKYRAKGGDPEEMTMLINPGIPIPEDASKIHGITHEDVKNKPTFMQVADRIYDFIGDSDLAGYNSNRFDVPMLMEEFARAGFEFEIDNRRTLDMQKIFYKMEPRTLAAALRFYQNKELKGAHDALADVKATVEVFRGQLTMYDGVDMIDPEGEIIPAPVKNDMQIIHDFTNDPNTLDVTQRLKYDKTGTIVFNFGKHIGRPVGQTLYHDNAYYKWIMEKDFSHQVKKMVTNILNDYRKTVKNN